jgi:hypothetical protein
MSKWNHRVILAMAICGMVGVALLTPILGAAHTMTVAYRCEPNGTVTFFAESYHSPTTPVGGIIVDGTTANFTSITDPLPGNVAANQIICSQAPKFGSTWQTVTVSGLTNGSHSITTTCLSVDAVECPFANTPDPPCFPGTLDIQCTVGP